MEVSNESPDATLVGVFLLYANVIKETMWIMPKHHIKVSYSVAYCEEKNFKHTVGPNT